MVCHVGGRRVDGLGETAQKMTDLIAHVSHGDHFTLPAVSSTFDVELFSIAAAGALNPLGQPAEKEAAGKLLVELAQRFLILQEIPQTHTVLQQQTHKLRLVANEGGQHGPVEVTGLEGDNKAQSASQYSV